MSQHRQSGLHPNADQLNAFVEHALPPHEREQTLAHLAECAACRSIVALSLPPVDEAVRPQPDPVRRPWFLGWNLAWPVAAALAALVPLALYVHRTATIPIAPPTETAKLQPPPPLAPPPPPAPPAPKVPPPPAAEEKPSAPPAALKGALAGRAEPRAPIDSKDAGTIDQQLYSELPLSRDGGPRDAKAFRNVAPGAEDNPAAKARQSADRGNSGIYGGTGQSNLNQNYVEGTPATNAAAAPPPPADATASSSDQTVVVTGASAMNGLSGAGFGSLALRVSPPPAPLPSGLPTLSTASSGRLMLALDTSNALFVSDDGGRRWRPVSTQWKGRAVRVALANPPAAQFHGGALRGGAGGAGARAGMMAAPATAPAASSNFRGGIQGTITDPTGAAVPDVEVIATNTDTGVQTRRRTSNDGGYSMTLQPGQYNVEVVAKGFQRLLQQNIVADNATMLSLSLKLTIGGANETVTVTDAPPMLDTTDATLGGIIENDVYSQLPLSSTKGTGAANAKKTPPPAAAPAAAAQAAPIPPTPLFEITTESGERWFSADGQTWMQRP